MISPHIHVVNDPDGVRLTLRNATLVIPPDMALELANLLVRFALHHDPLAVHPLPEVKPTGDPIR
jgi:hypothetical protein